MAMSTRQLAQGMIPHIDYEKSHRYKTLRQFPELRQSRTAVENMQFHHKPRTLKRIQLHSSTKRLEELSKTSLTETNSINR